MGMQMYLNQSRTDKRPRQLAKNTEIDSSLAIGKKRKRKKKASKTLYES